MIDKELSLIDELNHALQLAKEYKYYSHIIGSTPEIDNEVNNYIHNIKSKINCEERKEKLKKINDVNQE